MQKTARSCTDEREQNEREKQSEGEAPVLQRMLVGAEYFFADG
jgi:hypothetical protein